MTIAGNICFGFFNKLRQLFNNRSVKSRRSNSRRIRFSSSTIWRDITRKGKMKFISINPFVNYLNEYKRISQKCVKGEISLTDRRAIASRLSETQSLILASHSDHESYLRQFAVDNWNAMMYREKKRFINLALLKQKWIKSYANVNNVTTAKSNTSVESSDNGNDTLDESKPTLPFHSSYVVDKNSSASSLNLPLSRLSVINPRDKDNVKSGSITVRRKKKSKKIYHSISKPTKPKRKNNNSKSLIDEIKKHVHPCNDDFEALVSRLESICLCNNNQNRLKNRINVLSSHLPVIRPNENAKEESELASDAFKMSKTSNIPSTRINSKQNASKRMKLNRCSSNRIKSKRKKRKQLNVSLQTLGKDNFDNDATESQSEISIRSSKTEYGEDYASHSPQKKFIKKSCTAVKSNRKKTKKLIKKCANDNDSDTSARQSNVSIHSRDTENEDKYISNSQYKNLNKYFSCSVIKSKHIKNIEQCSSTHSKSNFDSDTSTNQLSIITQSEGTENEKCYFQS